MILGLTQIRLLILLFAFCHLAIGKNSKRATYCTNSACRLPDCFCAGARIPKGLSSSDIPQFVMMSFDGNVNTENFKLYQKIFNTERKNPNGCPIKGTFFVSHEWNDYWLTNVLYAQGHEIAANAITQESMEAFREADIDRWVKEIGGMKKILEIFGGIKSGDIKGFRSPHLQPGGDVMFDALNRSGLVYDSTLVAGENNPPMWPYTLDYKSSQDCKIGPCPKNSHPQMWEVPMVQYVDEKLRVCSMLDACQDKLTKESAYNLLLTNFMRHYQTNRAPFPIFMSTWLSTGQYRLDALLDFVDTILMLPNVYIVTISDVLQWIQNPIPCGTSNGKSGCALEGMKWSTCNSEHKRQMPCSYDQMRHCVLKRKIGDALRDRSLKSCQICPDEFPWLGNPDGSVLPMLGREIEESERPFWFPPRGLNLTTQKEEVKVIDPFESFNKMNSQDRFKQLLQRGLSDRSVNKRILARVMGDMF